MHLSTLTHTIPNTEPEDQILNSLALTFIDQNATDLSLASLSQPTNSHPTARDKHI